MLRLHIIHMILPKQSLFPFAVSWGSYILQGPPAQQMNGHCLFITFLARTIQNSSITVYLSGVRALHMEQGFLIRY